MHSFYIIAIYNMHKKQTNTNIKLDKKWLIEKKTEIKILFYIHFIYYYINLIIKFNKLKSIKRKKYIHRLSEHPNKYILDKIILFWNNFSQDY